MEGIPGRIVAPGLSRPDQGVDWLMCSPILAFGEELELLGLAPSCCLCQGSTNLEEHKELQVLLQNCITSRTILTRIGTPLDLGY